MFTVSNSTAWTRQACHIRRLAGLLGLVALALALVLTTPARAQFDPRTTLMQMILQLQTGTPNPGWYGVDLWQTMAMQTGNSGVYPILVQLGPVQQVTVTGQMPLPTGQLYTLTAHHQNGVSTWTIGISSLTRRIEYANFNVGGAPSALPYPQTPPDPGPFARPVNPPPNNPPPVSSDTSEACRKFPNLC